LAACAGEASGCRSGCRAGGRLCRGADARTIRQLSRYKGLDTRWTEAIQADPWGPVAQQVLEAIQISRPYGTAELLEGVVGRARKLAADSERAEVAAEVRKLVSDSGLSQHDFADRIGTS